MGLGTCSAPLDLGKEECELIVRVSRPMLMIFAAAMATPSSIGATSPTRSPMIIVNIFIFLVSLKLLVVNRGLGKGGESNARASDVKAKDI